MKRLLLSLMTVFSFIVQPAVAYAASVPGMSYPYSATTIYNLARGANGYKLSQLSHRDLEVTDRYGDTALCIAVRNHDKETYNNLLDAGSNPNPRCMEALESMRPNSGLSSLLTPKTGYVFAALAVGGGIALASGGGGGGQKVCKGYTNQDCPIAQHITEACADDSAYHKCAPNEKNTEENCADFVTNKDECRVCTPAYYLSDKNCYRRENTEHCTSFKVDEDACLTCEDGYYVGNFGQCEPGEIPNCMRYVSANECAVCEDGYVMSVDRDACIPPIDHCLYYSKSGKCTNCEEGYDLSDDKSACVVPIENCAKYNSDGTCSQCHVGYSIAAGAHQCVPTIPHCSIHNPDGQTCNVCEDGYNRTADKTQCVTTIDGCLEYDNSGKCTLCDTTLPILDGGRCYNQDTFCTDVRDLGKPNCPQPQIKKFCLLDDNISINTNYWSCVSGPANCTTANQDTGECIVCNTNFYPDSNGVCQAQYVANCDNDYVQNENKCRNCKNLYYLNDSGQCPSIGDANCETSVHNEKACETCKTGYYPDSDGVCQPQYVEGCSLITPNTNTCIKCNNLHYLTNNTCPLITNIDGCATSDGYTDKCTGCNTSYNFDIGTYKCYTDNDYCSQIKNLGQPVCAVTQTKSYCQLARGGQNDNYWECIGSGDPNCQQVDEASGKCSVCKPGYYPDSTGLCKEQYVEHCNNDYVPNQNKCQTCQNLYYLDENGQCPSIDDINCQTSETNVKACLVCKTGYFPNSSGVCQLQNVDYCETFTPNTNTCTKCQNLHYLTGNSCPFITHITGCDSSNGYDDECDTCKSNYNYDNAICYTDADYCTQIQQTGQTACAPTQTQQYCQLQRTGQTTTDYWKCIGDEDVNCRVKNPSTGKCTQCYSLYYPDLDGLCQPIDSSDTCNQSDGYVNACETCKVNYYKSYGVCYSEKVYCEEKLSTHYTNTTGCEVATQYPEFCPLPDKISTTYRACFIGTKEHCSAYDQTATNQCETCKNLYYLDDGSCLSINDSHCVTSVTNQKRCETCQSGYYPDANGVCQKIPNCVTSNGQDQVCTKCASKYYPSAGVCTLIPNCDASDGLSSDCITCNASHPQLDNGVCYTEEEYCTTILDYTSTTGCTISSQYPTFCPLKTGGYSDTYRKCNTGTIDKCTEYSQTDINYCTACQQGYYPDSPTHCQSQGRLFGCKTYLTTAAGCSECYDGFTLSNGACDRNTTYVNGGEYVYRVSNTNQQSGTFERTAPQVVKSGDSYSQSTIIGFTSTPSTAGDESRSSDAYFGATKFGEYDVFNTTYQDSTQTETSRINLDGDTIIGPSGHIINNSTEDGGYLIGLSSPFQENAGTGSGGNWIGNSSVYNAAAWVSSASSYTKTGVININYQTIATSGEIALNAYGIYSKNNAYNAYASSSLTENNNVSGIIQLSIDSYVYNYGIYAQKNAYNAYGTQAQGSINLNGISDNPKFYGVYAFSGEAANAAAGGIGTIMQINFDYQATSNTILGVFAQNGDAYNSKNATGSITLLSSNSIAINALNNHTAYNSYMGQGSITLPYGGTALKGSTAYNAYQGEGNITIGGGASGDDYQAEIINICASGTTACYNAYGSGAIGNITIYGTPVSQENFYNSVNGGVGTLAIYADGPTVDATTITAIDTSSQNGDYGNIAIHLGSGWNKRTTDNAEGVIAIDGSGLGAHGTIVIDKRVATDRVYVNEIIGVNGGSGGSDDSSITIGTSYTNLIRANNIYGIKDLSNSINSTMHISIYGALSDEGTDGYAYGIKNSSPTLTSNANITMKIHGKDAGSGGHDNKAYGLYNVDNGTNGVITLDSYSDVQLTAGMAFDEGTITNDGYMMLSATHSLSTLVGILDEGDETTNIYNNGGISLSTSSNVDVTGIKSYIGTATNTGSIIITYGGSASQTDRFAIGMYGDHSVIYNGTEQDHDNAIIRITATCERMNGIIGMYATGASHAKNYGLIILDASSSPNIPAYGMLATGSSHIENYGTIRIKTGGAEGVGLMAVDGSTVYNKGVIEVGSVDGTDVQDRYSQESTNTNVDSSVYNYTFIVYNPSQPSPVTNSTIVVDNASAIVNEGTIVSQNALSLSGSGKMMMKRGAKIISPSVSGTLTLGSDIVTDGNQDTYVTTNLVTGNTDDLNVTSESAMFTASTAVNTEDDNSIDGILTRKPFDTMVQSAALANYLETNYKGDNVQDFFAQLKTASNATEFNKVLSKELGLCLLPNFAQENFNVFRSLGNLITDNLFSKEMTNERMMVGYDYLALSRDTHKGITGYENNSNSSYFIGDKALNKRSRFGLGLSITRFTSDYDDDSDRDEMFAQLLASYMYDFGNKWRYAGVLHSGYGWGDYTRKLNQGDIDGNLHDFVYGLQNEFRYGIETPYAVIEPQLEMNFTGYYERRIKEENERGSILTKGTNNFSAESGIGLYASKEFNLEKYGKFKGRFGGSYYHEWAHPYGSIKAQMRGTDGWYKIESDGIFQRDRFMISADVIYTYKMFDLYLRGSQYFEKDSVAVFNAGLKYNF